MAFRMTPPLVLFALVSSAQATDREGVEIHYRKNRVGLECTERANAGHTESECLRFQFITFTGSSRKPKNLRVLSREFEAAELKKEEGFSGRVESMALNPSPYLSLALRNRGSDMIAPPNLTSNGIGVTIAIRRDSVPALLLYGVKSPDSYALPIYSITPASGDTLEAKTVRALLVGDPLRLAAIAAQAGAVFNPHEETVWNFGKTESLEALKASDYANVGPVVLKIRKRAMKESEFQKLLISLSAF
jgi:hypothetical protein